jgi:hypothetical protein
MPGSSKTGLSLTLRRDGLWTTSRRSGKNNLGGVPLGLPFSPKCHVYQVGLISDVQYIYA